MELTPEDLGILELACRNLADIWTEASEDPKMLAEDPQYCAELVVVAKKAEALRKRIILQAGLDT